MERMEQRTPAPNCPWRHSRRCAIALAIAACVTLAVASSRAGDVTSLYQWTDDDGVIRYTPDRAHIPLSQRGSALRVEPTPSSSGATADAPVTPEREAPLPSPPAPAPEVAPRDTLAAPPTPAPQPTATARSDPAGARPDDAAYAIQLSAMPVSHGVPPLPLIGLPNTVRLYQTRAERNGESWTQTRVGPFPTMASARPLLERLQPSFPGARIIPVSAAETRIAAATPAPPTTAPEAPPESAAEAPPTTAPEAPPEPATEAPPTTTAETPPEPAAEAPPTTTAETPPEPAAEAPPTTAPEAPPEPAPEYVYVIQLQARPKSGISPPLPRLDLPEGLYLFRTSFEKDGSVWERVRVGVFPTLAEARAMRARLEPRFPGLWIDRVPSAQHVASSRTAGQSLP
jgi:hypothetical protein